jgi:hypothetical protein
MDVFTKLFRELLVFVYHCFDRIVIHGYLTALSRPELVVHFFRDSGELSGNGTDAIQDSKGYASCQSTDDHYRHVRIKSTIRMLMEFNISRNRKPGHRTS